jgi:SAM-dependent methyltransferase
MNRSFEELIDEAVSAPINGWDFTWLAGRATEERPPWHYSELLADRMRRSSASLDLQTGGELLNRLPAFPRLAVATEGWPPNLLRAAARLGPRGIFVVGSDDDRPKLPFADETFDLLTARHPVKTWWDEIARVLSPGGTFLSQQIAPRSVGELNKLSGMTRRRSAATRTRNTLRRRISWFVSTGLALCLITEPTRAIQCRQDPRSDGHQPGSSWVIAALCFGENAL